MQFRLEGYYEVENEDDSTKKDKYYSTDTGYVLADQQYIKTVPAYGKETTVEGVATYTDKITYLEYEALADEDKSEYTALPANELFVEWNDLPTCVNGHKVTYEVFELGTVEGYTSSAPVFDSSSNTWTVTNTLDKGSLVIDKSVIIDNEKQENQDKTGEKKFYVTISRTVTGDGTYYVTSDNGALTKQSNDALPTGAVIEVPFSSDTNKWTKTISNLPFGEYTVQEVVNTAAADAATPNWVAVNADNAVKLNIDNTQFVFGVSKPTATAKVTGENTSANPAKAELVNTYTNSKYCIAVTKQWLINGKTAENVDDLVIAVKLQRTTTPSNTDSYVDVPFVTMGTTVTGNTTLAEPKQSDPPVPAGTVNNSENNYNYILLNKANNWSAVAVGVDRKDPNGIPYSFRWIEGYIDNDGWHEGPIDGWTLKSNTTVQSAEKDNVNLIFLTKLVNEKKTYSFGLTKQVYVNGAEATDATKAYLAKDEYTFTYNLYKLNDSNARITGDAGKLTFDVIDNTNQATPVTTSYTDTNQFTVTVKKGERLTKTITVSGLDAGKYELEEVTSGTGAVAGFELIQIDSTANPSNGKVTMTLNDASSENHTYTNNAGEGKLTIKKVVEGDQPTNIATK